MCKFLAPMSIYMNVNWYFNFETWKRSPRDVKLEINFPTLALGTADSKLLYRHVNMTAQYCASQIQIYISIQQKKRY